MRLKAMLGGLALLGGISLAGSAALAEKATDTLRIAFRDAVPNIDPYYNSQRTGLILAHQYLDTLVFRDPDNIQLELSAPHAG